ncbi:MAG TPA: hypothetical protein VMS00_09815 [Acidimicrobiales bacterium]|nr:hypothetical protein [Acidimicrobiales bacterium]
MSLRQRTSLSFAALALAVTILITGCGATVNLRVVVGRTGRGSVALVVSFPATTAAQLEDLRAGLPVADLRAAGWVVEGPKPGPGGSTVVGARHTFTNLSEVPALVADIAGSGPETNRPFRLAVTELHGLIQDDYTASGMVDLRCWLSCFDDPRLAASVGYPLGLSPAEIHRLFGVHPGEELTFGFEVRLPGTVTSSDAKGPASGGDLVWSPVLGKATTVFASSKTENIPVIRAIAAAIGAGALMVLFTATCLLWRRRGLGGRPGRRKSRVPVTGQR